MKFVPASFACVLFLASWLFVLMPANAASLYIDPGMSSLNRGDSITMAIRLDTDEAAGECVNAVDGVLTYSSNIEPIDISIGDSIFNIWIEQPKINKEERTITFAGGIPNGYCGRITGDPRLSNVLTKVIFQSPGFSISTGDADENKAVINFTDESTAYLNDGRGTKASLMTYGASIELSKRPGSTLKNDWKEEVSADNIPPEEFSIDLIKGDGNYSGKYYITFRTTDKQTGIDHYEVMEEPLAHLGSFEWGRADAPWLIPKQPHIHVLNDQSLNISIRVKAVDKAGNEYIATLIPDESLRTTPEGENTMIAVFAIASLLLIVLIFFVIRLIIKVKKRKIPEEKTDLSNNTEEVEDNEVQENYENEQQ